MITKDQVLNEQEINQVAGGSLKGVKPLSSVLGDTPASVNQQKTGDIYLKAYADWRAGA